MNLISLVYNLSITMKIYLFFYLFLALTLNLSLEEPDKECSASHFDLIGRYTLGKQDELNRTFTKIQ